MGKSRLNKNKAGKSKLIKMEVEVLYQTKQAILVSPDGDIEAWLPKSVIKMDIRNPNIGDIIEILTPEWLVREKELI